MPLTRGPHAPGLGTWQEMILEIVVLVTSCFLAPVLNHSNMASWIPLVTQDFDPVSTHSDAQGCS